MAERKLRVADVMTADVVTLSADDKLAVADDVMQLGRIRHMPVVDDNQRLVGIVTQRDLFRGALLRVLGHREAAQQALEIFRIRDAMERDVVTLSPGEPLRDAARLMLSRKIGCLVITEADRVVGILTEADFVKLQTDE